MADAIQAPAGAEGPTSHTQNQAKNENTYGYTREQQIEALHKLREPFSPEEIRYLPRMWCGNCKNSRGQGCQQHPHRKCAKCGQNMPGGHIDLRFVGHAEATNRLLNVDPFWDWEPLTVDERGLPQVDGYQGMWIRLTVCGMTRLGYGHADGKTGGDAVKEVIGDAIRNAGMRFGMALNLWTSSDLLILEHGGDETPTPAAQQRQDPAPARVPQSEPQHARPAEAPPKVTLADFKDKVARVWNNLDGTRQNLLEAKKSGLADEVVPVGDEGTPTRLGELLASRIAELEAAQSGERNAA
ncbi:hypothetical protein ACFV27_36810 [Streptomyces antimycoticus]|uniref:hypothetical protein n=1 Tax=Streptomyces antimycoticus TaxID=68175 RepID=UPI0036C2B8A4